MQAKPPKNVNFAYFVYFLDPGPVPETSPGLGVQFPVKMCDLDAYLLSYSHFRRFQVFGLHLL